MRTAELTALMQRTEGIEITSYLLADPAISRSGGVSISRAGGLISWTMRSTDNGFLNRALGFGTMSEATPAARVRPRGGDGGAHLLLRPPPPSGGATRGRVDHRARAS